MQSVGPIVFSTTLFQSLLNSAGFDPIKGPGSSCSAADASGQCVLPWGKNNTKAVASVILIANGVSFAVRALVPLTQPRLNILHLDDDIDIYNHRISR